MKSKSKTKSEPHINVRAISGTGQVVDWPHVDCVQQSDDASCFKVLNKDKWLVGVIPAQGWTIRIDYITA